MDPKLLAKIYTNLGKLYRLWEKFQLAHEHFSRSINLFTKYNDEFNLSIAYYGKALTFIKENNNEKAIEYINKAISLGEKLNNIELLSNLYEILAEIYEKMGEYNKSISVLKNLVNLKSKLNLLDDIDKIHNKINYLNKKLSGSK